MNACEYMPFPAPHTPTSDPTTYELSSAGPTALEPMSSELVTSDT